MSEIQKYFEIWIRLNNSWEIIWTVNDCTQSEVDMILRLSEEEYKEVLYWTTHWKIILDELWKKYKMEIEKNLNYRENEAA